MKPVCLISAIFLLVCASSASAQTIGFAIADSDTTYTGSSPDDLTGALGETFQPTSSTGGTIDGVTLTLPFAGEDFTIGTLDQVDENAGSVDVPPYQNGDYFEQPIQVTLSGLTPGDKYNVAAYEQGNATTFAFAGTGGTQTLTINGDFFVGSKAEEVVGVNYVASVETADGSGDIVFTASPEAGGFSGQIQGVGLSPFEAVPEPSTWALLALGLSFIAFRSKRMFVIRRLGIFSLFQKV
jgi:PEP-CTERM motif